MKGGGGDMKHFRKAISEKFSLKIKKIKFKISI